MKCTTISRFQTHTFVFYSVKYFILRIRYALYFFILPYLVISKFCFTLIDLSIAHSLFLSQCQISTFLTDFLYISEHQEFKSNARETWCVILVSASWHLLFRITALYTPFRSAQNHCLPDNVRPRGAFISVGDWTPTEKYLLLLTTCRSGSLISDWDENASIVIFKNFLNMIPQESIV